MLGAIDVGETLYTDRQSESQRVGESDSNRGRVRVRGSDRGGGRGRVRVLGLAWPHGVVGGGDGAASGRRSPAISLPSPASRARRSSPLRVLRPRGGGRRAAARPGALPAAGPRHRRPRARGGAALAAKRRPGLRRRRRGFLSASREPCRRRAERRPLRRRTAERCPGARAAEQPPLPPSYYTACVCACGSVSELVDFHRQETIAAMTNRCDGPRNFIG